MLSFLAMVGVADSLREVRERIRLAAVQAGRNSDSIKLIAVTKKVEPARILEAVNAGVFFLGENRVQEVQNKIQNPRFTIPVSGIEWHLIGNLQKNKVKTAVQLFDCIHSLDSISLAVELNRRSEQAEKIQRVLVQVKLSDEATKYGIREKGLTELLEKVAAMNNLKLEGLMTMPPFFHDPEKARPFFRRLRELADICAGQGFPLRELSMGMSNDYAIAIQEGATMVRIGTAIFGERIYGISH
jgi:pyridoxal phosphate enzyme (YggS family)